MITKLNHTEEELYKAVLHHGPKILQFCITDNTLEQYRSAISQEFLPYPIPPGNINTECWLIPREYSEFNVEQFCISQCRSDVELERVTVELELFKKHNMIMVLRTMKYIVDVLRENDIVWGVGRGSSVASYCLYLLGVHKIDSIKYNLPLDEFFR